MGGFSDDGLHADEAKNYIEREFSFAGQGRFALKIYDGFVILGRHLCAERVIDHGTVYDAKGVPVRIRALSLQQAVIYCSSCGSRVVFPVDIQRRSAQNIVETLRATESLHLRSSESLFLLRSS